MEIVLFLLLAVLLIALIFVILKLKKYKNKINDLLKGNYDVNSFNELNELSLLLKEQKEQFELYKNNLENIFNSLEDKDEIENYLKIARLDSKAIILKEEKVKLTTLLTKAIEPFKTKIKPQLNITNITLLLDLKWTSEAIINLFKLIDMNTDGNVVIESSSIDEYNKVIISTKYRNKIRIDYEKEVAFLLAKKIITLQNGDIYLENNGVGISFIIRIKK